LLTGLDIWWNSSFRQETSLLAVSQTRLAPHEEVVNKDAGDYIMINVKSLQPLSEKENLEERIAKICEENDIVLMALFGSFARGNQKKE
jgi:hypothetical protein